MAKSTCPPPEISAAARVGAVVLAAGASTRMRQPKQLMAIGGTPLIVRTVRAVSASPAWPVVVVLGNASQEVRPLLARFPLQLVDNSGWTAGIGTSLRCGVETLERFSCGLEGVLVALADQPYLSSAAIGDLFAAFQGRHAIAAAHYSGIVGAPAIFGRDFFPELLALPDAMGAQRLLRAHVNCVTAVELPEFATDLDTPEDYQRFLDDERKKSRLRST